MRGRWDRRFSFVLVFSFVFSLVRIILKFLRKFSGCSSVRVRRVFFSIGVITLVYSSRCSRAIFGMLLNRRFVFICAAGGAFGFVFYLFYS